MLCVAKQGPVGVGVWCAGWGTAVMWGMSVVVVVRCCMEKRVNAAGHARQLSGLWL